jgi:hypothetical protein
MWLKKEQHTHSSYSKIVIQPWRSARSFFRQMICPSGIKAKIQRETCTAALFVRKSCFMLYAPLPAHLWRERERANRLQTYRSAEFGSHPRILNLAENIPG